MCEEHTENRTQNDCSTEGNISSKIIKYPVYSSLCTAYFLLTCLNFCLYRLSIHHKCFSSWVVDLILLLTCFLLLQPFTLTLTIACGGITSLWKSLDSTCTLATFTLLVAATIVLLTNIILTTLALLPACCRACGYNRCVRSVDTRESQTGTKRDIPFLKRDTTIPFFIVHLLCHNKLSTSCKMGVNCRSTSNRAISCLFFCHSPLHSWKSKTKKAARQITSYTSTIRIYSVQQNTHRTIVFISEGISETCNTDYPHVSEDEVDRELNLS